MEQNNHSTRKIHKLLVIAYLVLLFVLFSHTAYSESLTDQLISASKNGDTPKVKELIAKGLNIKNIVGETPLTIASKKGSIKIVKTLLDSGADANLKGKYGWTALMNAVTPGHVKVVEELLLKGADPNIKNDSGTTAIMIAEKLKKPEMIKLLKAAEK